MALENSIIVGKIMFTTKVSGVTYQSTIICNKMKLKCRLNKQNQMSLKTIIREKTMNKQSYTNTITN